MYAPEEQQVEICLLKSNLEDIENDLVAQRSALPALDAENEQQYRETMNALRIARSLNSEIERVKQENVCLIAKRMQLKRQCEEAAKAVENARVNRNNIMEQLNEVEKEEEELIRKYEDSLREKADRFRKARVFYNDADMSSEINNVEAINNVLANEMEKNQSAVDILYRNLESLSTDVPEDLMDILGKVALVEKLNELEDQCKVLEKKRDNLLNRRSAKTSATKK